MKDTQEKLAPAFSLALGASRAICNAPEDSAFISSQLPSQIHISDEQSGSNITFSFPDSVSKEPKAINYRIPRGTRTNVVDQYEIVCVDPSGIYELLVVGYNGKPLVMATYNEQDNTATFGEGIGPKRQVRAVSVLRSLEARASALLQQV
jgi:hypothetical protein